MKFVVQVSYCAREFISCILSASVGWLCGGLSDPPRKNCPFWNPTPRQVRGIWSPSKASGWPQGEVGDLVKAGAALTDFCALSQQLRDLLPATPRRRPSASSAGPPDNLPASRCFPIFGLGPVLLL